MTKKKEKRADLLSILRYGTIAVLLIYVIVLIITKGDGNASFSDVASSVKAAAQADRMTEGDGQDLKRLYQLNAGDYEDVLLYYTQETMGVEELLLIHTRSQADVDTVEDAILKRKAVQMENFEGYGAEQVHLIDRSIIKIRGRYILFVVSPDAQRIEKAFNHVI